VTTTAPTAAAERQRPLGVFAIIGAILAFSISSTLVKKAAAPGPTIAFWRMVLSSLTWTAILRATQHRWVTRAELRRAIVPGVAFGLNITCFFTAITHTSVANAEFIGSLTPLLLVPAGAVIFHEHINPGALLFGLVSLAGLGLVLFNAPSNGDASWLGNGFAFTATLLWSVYLITSRAMRSTSAGRGGLAAGGMSVVSIMASVMPVASLTILPIVVLNGQIADVTVHSGLYIVLLTVLTGTLAHGLIVFAQRTVPVGSISIMQVAQPALAVIWSVLLLGRSVRPVQVAGMALVLAGLVLVTVQTQRLRR
jgi:drug/metabolite transporter (DMT)-like permease